MSVGIATVAISGIYPRLASRMIERFAQASPGYNVKAWVNTLPPGTSPMVVDGYDYTPYCAKPWAMYELQTSGVEIAILLDAAFYPIRDIKPLIGHIERVGYYFCDNEFMVGEWCSDGCAAGMSVTRERLWQMRELSSYCVGLDLRRSECQQLLGQWRSATYNPWIFPGRHTAGTEGRNPGHVSIDPRVKGHRHDQSVLSILANQFGMTEYVKRPKLTAYAAREWNKGNIEPTEETVLVNWGKLFLDGNY